MSSEVFTLLAACPVSCSTGGLPVLEPALFLCLWFDASTEPGCVPRSSTAPPYRPSVLHHAAPAPASSARAATQCSPMRRTKVNSTGGDAKAVVEQPVVVPPHATGSSAARCLRRKRSVGPVARHASTPPVAWRPGYAAPVETTRRPEPNRTRLANER